MHGLHSWEYENDNGEKTVKISLIILTFNRMETAIRSLAHNLHSAGGTISELIHVDNGSNPDDAVRFSRIFKPDVQILNKQNLGVAKGYNRGLLLATGEYVVILGCDRLMPENWLRTFLDAFNRVPQTGVVSLYSNPHAERFRGDEKLINGLRIQPAFAAEARMHSREFLIEAGLFREDFGLYGFEDVEWCERAERTALKLGKINYVIPSMPHATHLGYTVDSQEYLDFKKEENDQTWKPGYCRFLWQLGSPYYQPYLRNEENLLEKYYKTL